MHKQILPLAKAVSTAGLLSVTMAACVSTSTPASSSSEAMSSEAPSSQAVSSIAISSAAPSSVPMSSVAPSSVAVSSIAPSSQALSSVAPSSMAASSSSMMSSSSEADACAPLIAKGGELYNTAGVSCVYCHGDTVGATTAGGATNTPIGTLEPEYGTKANETHEELDTYIATFMSGYAPLKTSSDVDGDAEAIAAYLYDAAGWNWCDRDMPMSSSSQMSSEAASSMAASSSAPAGEVVDLYAVNAGGKAITLQDGTEFTADFYSNAGNTGALTDLFNIPNIPQQDLDLYRTERWGEFTYEFPVKDGTYDVKLYVMEGWFGPQNAGNRVFDVTAEGQNIVDDLDPLVETGHDQPFVVEANGIQVTDGKLSLDFTASVDAASIRAIVVRGLEGNKAPFEADPGTIGTAAVPADCSGNSVTTANDFVLFDGSQVGDVSGKTLGLHGNWVLQEVWDANAKLEAEDTAEGKAIAYSNAGIFTGFKFAPPTDMTGTPSAFKFSGAEIYIDYVTNDNENNLPSFGFRVNYEGEQNPNGSGGASTAKWMVNENNQEPYNTQSKSCSLVTLKAPLNWNWDATGNMGNKLIWEMKNGWDNGDKIRIRRIVFKDFEYKM